jgi:hypothetical protein
MKKLTVLATLAVLAVSAQAQKSSTPAPAPAPTSTTSSSSLFRTLPLGFQALGWDNNLGHITARLGLSQNNALDVGVGLGIDASRASDVVQFGVSALYLLKLQEWGMLDNYAVAGGWITQGTDLGITGYVGLQPEITVMDHVILAVRFGLEVPIIPDFGIVTKGDPISVVNGINFKIVW